MIRRWSAPTPLLPDELLSSWLVRSALAVGCDPLYFTRFLWPKWRCWTVDVDRAIDDQRLGTLSSQCGIAAGAFRAASVVPVASEVNGPLAFNRGPLPWITTLGSRNTRRRTGIQYCPHCLKGDPAPFYRLPWRFAWHTLCEKHGSTLLDRCPSCGAAVEAHRLPVESIHVAQCAGCGFDLRDADTIPCQPRALTFQRTADTQVLSGAGIALDRPIATVDWFVLARFYIALTRRAANARLETLTTILSALDTSAPTSRQVDRGVDMESMSTAGRQDLFACTWPLLAAGRERLLQALLDSGISRQGFVNDRQIVPSALSDIVEQLPDSTHGSQRSPRLSPQGPRSRRAIRQMMARLERVIGMKNR